LSAPRRVAHVVCTANFAGVERYVTYIAPSLAKRGWDVTVVGGDSARMPEELGDVRHLPGTSLARVVASLARFDRSVIVHAHMTAAEAASVAVHAARRFPVVVTRHFAAPRGSSLLGRAAAPAIRRAVSEQIAISDFVAAGINEPSVTIRNAVPDNAGLARGDRVVLMVQRLDTEKHTADALRAWARTTLPADGWRLRIVGAGREHESLAGLTARLDLSQSVEFLGSRSDVVDLMREASILVATAPAEPFGLSVVEAMAAGLPVICARGGAHLETAGAVTKRWLFEPGADAELAEMLQTLAADAAERERYGRALQKHQRAALSIESHVGQLEAIYARIRR